MTQAQDANGLFMPSQALIEESLTAAKQDYYGPQTIYRRGNLGRFCTVPVAYLVDGRFQPRKAMNEESLRELAEDIKAHGIVNPIKVFVNEKGRLEILAGHRRLAAAKLAALDLVPVDVMEGTLEFMREVTIIDNLQREDLTPLEEAEAFRRMAEELRISDSEIARRVGKSRGFVQQRLAIARADSKVLEAISDGGISLTVARNIAMGTDSKKLQRKALGTIQKRIKTGARTDEADVRRIVADLVQQTNEEHLVKLGWKTANGYIWGGAERPRRWDGAEITQALREQRLPTGEPPTDPQMTDDQRTMLSVGYMAEHASYQYHPWIALTSRESYQTEFFAITEIDATCRELGAAFAEIRRGYVEKGWDLVLSEGGVIRAKHIMGRSHPMMKLSDAREFLKRVQDGKEPTDDVFRRSTPWTCEHCNKVFKYPETNHQWVGRQQVCPTCYDVAHARYGALRERIKEEYGNILVRMDADLLRMLLCRHISGAFDAMETIHGKGFADGKRRWANLERTEVDTLRTVLLDCMAEDEYERERWARESAQ